TQTTFPTSIQKGAGYRMSFACSGSTIFYAGGDGTSDNTVFNRVGTMNADGTITWGTPYETSAVLGGAVWAPDAAIDSNGNPWMAVRVGSSGSFSVNVYECTAPPSCGWSLSTSLSEGSNIVTVDIVALTAGKMALVIFGSSAGSVGPVTIETFSGSAWSSSSQTAASYLSGLAYLMAGLAVIKDTTEVAVASASSTGSNMY